MSADEVRERCRLWVDRYQRQEGAGEYGVAGRIILRILDGTYWCETHRCPGHPAETRGQPCIQRGGTDV